ncbi:hypothetical protein GCM10027048_29750 [Hymenobacter coalescens]
MTELANPPSGPAPAAAPASRRGHWSLYLLGLVVSVAGWLWCVHWLSKADLSAQGGAGTLRYTRAAVLLLPASGGICFCGGSLLRRGRWLLWLAGLLWAAAGLVLAGVFGLLRSLDEATATRTALLALGFVLSAAASVVAFRQLRRTRRGRSASEPATSG